MRILFCASHTKAGPWLDALRTALPAADVQEWQPGAPAADYAVVWSPPQAFFDEQPGLRVIFNMGAGVDALLSLELPPDALVVRLPGLVGPGLRKNAIFDLHHGNALDAVDSRGRFQFYPMVNLWDDLQVALGAGLRTLHLTAAPLSIGEVAREAFHRPFDNVRPGEPAVYDFRSKHDRLFGGDGGYQYSRRESMLAIRAYAQSEPRAAGAGA